MIQDPVSPCFLGVSDITPVYENHKAWNDYVINDGSSTLKATGQTCTGAEVGQRACFHAGIMRKVTTNRTSCLNMTAVDSLAAMRWVCSDASGFAEFTTAGFMPGKKLSDLIDASGPSWRTMSVTVSDGIFTRSSATTQPWANPIAINNNGIGPGGSVSGTIYLVTQNPSALTTLDQSKVAYVIMPDVVHTGTVAGAETIVTTTADFIWLEGEVDLNNVDGAAFQTSGRFIEGRGIRVYSSSGTGASGLAFPLIGAGRNMRFSEVYISNINNGFLLNVSHVVISEAYVHNVGVAFNMASAENTIINSVTSGSSGDMISGSQTDNTILNFTGVGMTSQGINFAGGGNSFHMNAAVANAGLTAIRISAPNNNSFVNSAAAHSGNGLQFNGGTTDNNFAGLLLVGNNSSTDCNIAGAGGNPGITGTCEKQGLSTHTLTTGVDLSSAFVGRITVDDSFNGSDTIGLASIALIGEWTRFENDFRGWSPEGTSITDTALRARCTANCRIYDWSLSASDTLLRNRLSVPTGNSTFNHTYAAGGSPTFLINAVELLDDAIGDDDGLCETGEHCLYTPNIGAYQGHGSLVSAGTISTGTITGVTLWQYETNGR